MRKLLWLGVIAIALLEACSKDKTVYYDVNKQFSLDSTAIVNYLSQKALPATYDSAGLWYNVSVPGDGDSIKRANNATVTVLYKGQLLNGTVFDSTGTTPFKGALQSLILGWGLGLEHVKKGGTIRLYLPSALGYGPYQYGSIPANSPLIFDITVQDVQ
jgi:FKBP-type peptidyl-prolyl cis-trans isomerase FkpA